MAYRKSWEKDYLERQGRRLRRPDLGEPRPPKEVDEQIALAAYLDRLGVLWCHVPNGGYREPRGAAMFVAQGVKRGVPDNLIFSPPPRWSEATRQMPLLWAAPFMPCHAGAGIQPVGVAIEMKRRGATLSDVKPEQATWGRQMARRGWYWFVARGAGEAIDELKQLGYSTF